MTETEIITLAGFAVSLISLLRLSGIKSEIEFLLVGRSMHMKQIEKLEEKLAALENDASS